MAAALDGAPTVGYLWTSAAVGYSLKYAHRIALPDGGERIVLALNEDLAETSPRVWAPSGASTTNYEFTVFELRLNAAGTGDGKASLASNVAADNPAGTVALESYAAAPVVLQGVRR